MLLIQHTLAGMELSALRTDLVPKMAFQEQNQHLIPQRQGFYIRGHAVWSD